MAIKPIEVEYILKDGVSSKAKEVGKSVKEVGKSAKYAGSELQEGINQAGETIRQMTTQVEKLGRKIGSLPASMMRSTMEADLAKAKEAIEKEGAALDELQQSHDKVATSARSLVQEQRQLIQALAQLKREGKDNTAEYQEMAQAAAEITDALGDVRQETNALAHDNSGFAGMTAGLQGVAGGFTALTGTISLFVGESEELQRIQTRLQAVMAITMGIQQALDAVNRSSAFSTVILAKAKTMLTAANMRLATALGVSTVAAQALMATLTLGLSAAITALIVWYDKYTDAQAEANKAMQERAEVEKDARVQVLKSRVALEETIDTIKTFNGSKAEEARKVKELNQTYGATFGYYDSLAKWYDVLSAKSQDYIQVLFLQAKAQSLISKAAEADGEVGKIETTPLDEYASWTDKLKPWLAGRNIPLIKKNEVLKTAKDVRDGYLSEARKVQEEIKALAHKQDLGGIGGRLSHQDPEELKRDRDALRKSALERAKTIDDMRKSLADAMTKGEAYVAQAGISAKQDGYAKERAQAERHWEEERQRIEREGQERLALIAKLRSHGATVSLEQELAVKAQTQAELSANTDVKSARLKAIDDKEIAEWQEYLTKFADFAAKRKAIEEAYTKDVAKLRAAQNEANTEVISRAIAEATRQKNLAMRSVDDQEAEATRGVTDAIARLYEDASDRSVTEIKRIIAESESLINYLKTTPLEAMQDFGGVSAAELRRIKADPNAIKPLEDALKRLKGQLGARNPLEAFFAAWRSGVEDIKKGTTVDIGKGIAKIGTAVAGVMPAVKEMGQALGDLFGDSELGDNVGILADGLAGIGNTAAGVGKIMAGDILGGAQSIMQGIGSIVAMASKAESAHREALEQVHQAQLAFEREYQIALLRTRLLAEEASMSFGTDEIRKASEALKVYADAQQLLKEQIKGTDPRQTPAYAMFGWMGIFDRQIAAYKRGVGGLANIGIVTGHRKTGLFGWGKGEDVYSSILDVYPKVIKANGELDTLLLQEILKTRKLSDEDRRRLEGLLETVEVAKESAKAFDDYLSSTFGSLGTSMTDAILTSVKEGGDAIEIFARDAGKVLEGLLKQSIFASLLKQHFEEYRNKLKQAHESKSGADLLSEINKITKGLMDGLKATLPVAKATAEAGLQAIKDQGFTIDEATSGQTSKSGAFSSMTQEQGTKLEGLFTSGQMHWASMDDQMRSITADLSGVLDSLAQIVNNTAPIATLLEELQLIRRDGVTIK